MPKKVGDYGVPNTENPEWNAKEMATAKRFNDLPEDLQRVLGKGKRGPQKAPTKTLVSIRLSPDVVEALRARGKGWQTVVDETLRKEFVK